MNRIRHHPHDETKKSIHGAHGGHTKKLKGKKSSSRPATLRKKRLKVPAPSRQPITLESGWSFLVDQGLGKIQGKLEARQRAAEERLERERERYRELSVNQSLPPPPTAASASASASSDDAPAAAAARAPSGVGVADSEKEHASTPSRTGVGVGAVDKNLLSPPLTPQRTRVHHSGVGVGVGVGVGLKDGRRGSSRRSSGKQLPVELSASDSLMAEDESGALFLAGTRFAPQKVLSSEEFATLYTHVYRMCTQRQPNKICESMYRLLDQAIEEYIRDVILNALTVCIRNNGNLLLTLVERWEMFSSYLSAIDRVFAYLNKYFCTMNERETTNVLGIRKFHAIVLNNEDVQKHVIKYVNQKIMETRATLQELDDSFPPDESGDEDLLLDTDSVGDESLTTAAAAASPTNDELKNEREEKSSSPSKPPASASVHLSSSSSPGSGSGSSRRPLGRVSRSRSALSSALSRSRSRAHALSLSNIRLSRASSTNMASNNPNSALSPAPRVSSSRHTRAHTHSHTRSPQLRGRTRTLPPPQAHPHSAGHAHRRQAHSRSISSVSPLRRTRHNVHADTPTPTLGGSGVVSSKSASGSPLAPSRLFQRHNSTPLFTRGARVGSRSPPVGGRPSAARMLSLPSFPPPGASGDHESPPPELRQAAQAHAWVRKAIEVFVCADAVNLSVYRQLETLLMKPLAEYYERLGKRASTMGLLEFFQNALNWREQERSIIRSVLHRSTHRKVMRLFYDKVLRSNRRELLEKRRAEWEEIFCGDMCIENASTAHQLFRESESELQTIASIFEASLAQSGADIVGRRVDRFKRYNKNQSSGSSRSGDHRKIPNRIRDEHKSSSPPPSSRSALTRAALVPPPPPSSSSSSSHVPAEYDVPFVESLISLYDRFHGVASIAFQSHHSFESSLDAAFSRLLNLDSGNVTTTELLAHFCDFVLSNTYERRTQQQVKGYLDRLGGILSYTADDDLFLLIYRQHLAQRLLTGTSQSLDMEWSMIAKLKMKSDPHATSKLEGMSSDMKHSSEMNKLFAAQQRSNSVAASSSSSSAGANSAIPSLRRGGGGVEFSRSISRLSHRGGGGELSSGTGGVRRSVSRLDDVPHRLLTQHSPRSTIAAPGLMPCFAGDTGSNSGAPAAAAPSTTSRRSSRASNGADEKADSQKRADGEEKAELDSKSKIESLPHVLNVKLLTTGWWPTIREVRVAPPAVFQRATDTYSRFHKLHHPRRQLKWAHNLGNVELVLNLNTGSYRVLATTLQAFVLTLFDDAATRRRQIERAREREREHSVAAAAQQEDSKDGGDEDADAGGGKESEDVAAAAVGAASSSGDVAPKDGEEKEMKDEKEEDEMKVRCEPAIDEDAPSNPPPASSVAPPQLRRQNSASSSSRRSRTSAARAAARSMFARFSRNATSAAAAGTGGRSSPVADGASSPAAAADGESKSPESRSEDTAAADRPRSPSATSRNDAPSPVSAVGAAAVSVTRASSLAPSETVASHATTATVATSTGGGASTDRQPTRSRGASIDKQVPPDGESGPSPSPPPSPATLSEWMDVTQVTECLEVDEVLAKRVLHSLSCSDFPVLEKDPPTPFVLHSHRFRINADFRCKYKNIQLPEPFLVPKLKKDQAKPNRKFAIDAALVALMKRHKTLHHDKLVGKCLARLRRFPDVKVEKIESRIEHLIDVDFLEIDEDDAASSIHTPPPPPSAVQSPPHQQQQQQQQQHVASLPPPPSLPPPAAPHPPPAALSASGRTGSGLPPPPAPAAVPASSSSSSDSAAIDSGRSEEVPMPAAAAASVPPSQDGSSIGAASSPVPPTGDISATAAAAATAGSSSSQQQQQQQQQQQETLSPLPPPPPPQKPNLIYHYVP